MIQRYVKIIDLLVYWPCVLPKIFERIIQNQLVTFIEEFLSFNPLNLRIFLGGGAARAIKWLAISDGNYNKAVKILEE